MNSITFVVFVLLQAAFVFTCQASKLYLKYNDPKCSILGTGGDVATVGVADCEDCQAVSCLHLIHNTATTWVAAKKYCDDLKELDDDILESTVESSHMVVIMTDEKLQVVKEFLNGLSGSLKPRAAWIGLRSSKGMETCSFWERVKCSIGISQCSCKEWMWLDAVPFSGSPNYWSPGQPKGALTVNGGNCAKMVRDHEWRYFDDPCSTSLNVFRQANAVLCEATLYTQA